jgi:hypothetical protein
MLDKTPLTVVLGLVETPEVAEAETGHLTSHLGQLTRRAAKAQTQKEQAEVAEVAA